VPQVIGIALLAIAQAFDFVSFLAMIVARGGIGVEANPIVRDIASTTHLPGITIIKVATVVLVASAVVIVGRHHRTAAAMLLVFGVLAGVAGGLSNIASM
jgi:hypothetical protein